MAADARDELTAIAKSNLCSMHRNVLAAFASFAFNESEINFSTMLASRAGGRDGFSLTWPGRKLALTGSRSPRRPHD